ncbi:hypothetical protein JCM10213_008680 [Rhodosporidiobolus nylandii]
MDPSTLSSGITSSSALSLVSSVRHATSVPPTFLSGLDALLHSSDTEPLRRGDVVELQGLPGSGKTALLLHLAATTLLPRFAYVRFEDLRGGPGVACVEVGGKEEVVAFLDCSARAFPISRLSALLRRHLRLAIRRYRAPKGLGAPREEELDALVEEALSRLHVFKPSSTLQLAVTVQDLPVWAADRAEQNGDDEPELGMVLIDGMSEFAWADQLTRENAAATTTSSSTPPTPPLRLLLRAIANLRASLSPLIFLTQWVFRPSSVLSQTSQESLPFYTHHFAPPHWPSISSAPRPAGKDPLEAPIVGVGAERWPSFPLALHITLHPPEKGVFRRGSKWSEVTAERAGGKGAKEGDATEGIKCVVRAPGGRELGSWEMSVAEEEITT